MKQTKVVCPVCGTEMRIAEQEYTTTGIVIGKDSGLGTVVLQAAETQAPVTKAQKRIEALKAAGIDTSNLFAMETGNIARMSGGVISTVQDDDPIFQLILNSKTIPNRQLFRRWVMSQMFHMLDSYHGFTKTLRYKGTGYQWRMIAEELKTQVKLYKHDRENYEKRNKWFNAYSVFNICSEYYDELQKNVENLATKKCKGIPYKTVGKKNYFCSDLDHKLFNPIFNAMYDIRYATEPQTLYCAFRKFMKAYVKCRFETVSKAFIDCYKGAGAYYTMKNLILFHDCVFEAPYQMNKPESLEYMETKMKQYAATREGWRLFGVMLQLISDNNIDIKQKMSEWRKK